ncbi:EamA family transporter RarD [Nakamurella sp. YIM 132087]|uniref:EamA family transporter RarD n=2 Tax=Nakamurella alba TaxID=2665158 RepID=A0A7K1FK26_9ACTN|nr:EamA family transporter RarD [Nakamurella alba]
MWGLFPLFWPLLKPAGSVEILAHRMLWGLLLTALLLTAARQWRTLRQASARTWGLVVLAAALIAVNWGVYIYAVNAGHVVEGALGYFVNPLFSVLLGVVVFRERLRVAQWVSVALGLAAVLVIAIAGGHVPWIALALAVSFGLYGLVKKVVPLPAQASLTAEGLVVLVPALTYLLVIEFRGDGTFVDHGIGHSLLLAAAGVVTVLPLFSFSVAARLLPLSTVGLLQYLTPVMQFLLGVLYFHEHMSAARWVGFVLIWCALVLFSFDSVRAARRAKAHTVGSPDSVVDPDSTTDPDSAPDPDAGISASGPARTG